MLPFLAWPSLVYAAGAAADLGRQLAETSLNPAECYRVRELALPMDEARLFFTDGYLIFSKPVAGAPISAVFSSDVEGGDGEVLLLPPNRGERRSLFSYIGSPNLDEHIQAAVLIFSDDTYSKLAEQMRHNPANRRSPEMGALMADQWSTVVRNLATSFETRLVFDLLTGGDQRRGFLAATMTGRRIGNFDLYYDRYAREQIMLGKLNPRGAALYFDVWTSFVARSFRNRPAEPDLTLQDYRIEARMEPDLDMHVVTRVGARPVRPMPVLAFDIAPAMAITEARIDGQPAEVFQRESLREEMVRNSANQMFVVVPPAPLQPGRVYSLEFQHAGKVIADAGNQVYYVGARANWFPNLGLQFATYDLQFRYPTELDLVTPGDVVDDRKEDDWRITRRRTAVPIRMAGFNLGHYQRIRTSRDGFTVEVCANQAIEPALAAKSGGLTLTPSADPPARLEQLAQEIASAMEFMAQRFGPPALPALTVSPVPGFFGQGFPGLIYLSTLSYLEPTDEAWRTLGPQARLFFSEFLHAHETAHQWWGNVVVATGYHDEWLMEALADYSALLYLEHKSGSAVVAEVLDVYKTDLLKKTASGSSVESSGPIVLGMRLENSQAPQAYHSIVYGKGSWILHMLRGAMGDERFLTMLHTLRQQYEHASLSTEDFRLLAARFLAPEYPDRTLEDFFDQWVYSTGVPSLQLAWSVKGKAPALRLEGAITQSDVDENFSVPAPVEIQMPDGTTLRRWVRTETGTATFTAPVKQAPVRVLLDPEHSILWK